MPSSISVHSLQAGCPLIITNFDFDFIPIILFLVSWSEEIAFALWCLISVQEYCGSNRFSNKFVGKQSGSLGRARFIHRLLGKIANK